MARSGVRYVRYNIEEGCERLEKVLTVEIDYKIEELNNITNVTFDSAHKP